MPSPRPLPQFAEATGEIAQFDNVGLRYGTGAETLSDLAFTLREGETLGVVGESGSGKSLATQAILQLLPSNATTRGTIT